MPKQIKSIQNTQSKMVKFSHNSDFIKQKKSEIYLKGLYDLYSIQHHLVWDPQFKKRKNSQNG